MRPDSLPIQAILTIKYWTVLSVLAVSLSLCSYVVMTWACQTFWLFKSSPKTFPFLCEPPARHGVVGPGDGRTHAGAPALHLSGPRSPWLATQG